MARGVCRRVFYRETFLKFNKFYHFMNLLLRVLSSLCLPLDRKEELAGTLWPCPTVTRNVPDVGRRGWEMFPVLRSLNARFVRHSHLLKYNNWPPRPTSPGKNVESRRRRQKLPVVLPPLMNPSDITLLGQVHSDKPSLVESTPTKKKRHSESSPKSSKRKHSKPTADDLKSLDKWSERFS